jgi:hypothetical protein
LFFHGGRGYKKPVLTGMKISFSWKMWNLLVSLVGQLYLFDSFQYCWYW